MAETGSWDSIRRHGLLSTEALLDLFEIGGAHRKALLSTHRPENVTIRHPIHGTAVIRDQKPMDDSGLRRALRDGLTPGEWYRILNRMVFFWVTEERLDRLLNARAYRDKRHTVLIVDTARLLQQRGGHIMLSPINSGCTKPYPHRRGRDTFLPLVRYPFECRRRRGLTPIAELAVHHSVPNISRLVIRVEEVGGGRPRKLLWKGQQDEYLPPC